ncbi:MAG: hypothetical protein ABI561_10360 [Bradyrhizobium sp.]
MTRSVATSPLKPEFNAFLFAAIGKNNSGMQISVLSGLAQAELDPWQEAAELAQLPGKTAIERLALLIGKMPDKGWACPDTFSVATRLIALLPRQLAGSSAIPLQSVSDVMNSRPWLIYVVIMSFVLGSQFMIASHQPPTKAGDVSASSAVAPQATPLGSQ